MRQYEPKSGRGWGARDGLYIPFDVIYGFRLSLCLGFMVNHSGIDQNHLQEDPTVKDNKKKYQGSSDEEHKNSKQQ
jgi:hypothetical protein